MSNRLGILEDAWHRTQLVHDAATLSYPRLETPRDSVRKLLDRAPNICIVQPGQSTSHNVVNEGLMDCTLYCAVPMAQFVKQWTQSWQFVIVIHDIDHLSGKLHLKLF